MDTVIEAIRTLLTAGVTPNLYKFIHYGTVHVPAKSELPSIEVMPVSTEMANLGTHSMRNDFTIRITIKDILKNFITSDTNKSAISHIQEMVKRMEERESSGIPKSTTVLGVLHNNRKLNNTVNINNIGTIEYNEEEFNDSWIVTASILITASLITTRS